jgi:hypothetical protein
LSRTEKDAVTTSTCKLITDATYAKIDATEQLLRAQIQGIKNTIYVSSLLLGVFLTSLEILINFLHH